MLQSTRSNRVRTRLKRLSTHADRWGDGDGDKPSKRGDTFTPCDQKQVTQPLWASGHPARGATAKAA